MTNEAEFVTQLQAKGFGIVEAAEYVCICASASVCMGIGIRACGCSPALLLLRTFRVLTAVGCGMWESTAIRKRRRLTFLGQQRSWYFRRALGASPPPPPPPGDAAAIVAIGSSVAYCHSCCNVAVQI
jgi:hypothetical protein